MAGMRGWRPRYQEYTVHLPASLLPTSSSKTIRVEFVLVAEQGVLFVAANIQDTALAQYDPAVNVTDMAEADLGHMGGADLGNRLTSQPGSRQ